MKRNHPRLTKVMVVHYIKLVYRSLLFLGAAALYIYHRVLGSSSAFGGVEQKHPFMLLIWLIFALEMALRFFPSSFESMGCQKQFPRNYIPCEDGDAEAVRRSSARQTVPVLLSWILLNGLISAVYFLGWIDKGILLLIALAYSICDMICILFFCPFQTWMMKNKCCGSCRIYNWDYAMMFTPLIWVDNFYAQSLLLLSLALLIKWEVIFHRHPERFSEATNQMLTCANCPEKLCQHKSQLRSFLKKQRSTIEKELARLKKRKK